MRHTLKNKLFVLAFSITSILCFGQQNRSAICRLGEIRNDSLLPYIQSLEVDCNKDVKNYLQKADQLTALKQIELKSNASSEEWEALFRKIKTQTTLKTIVFNENRFSSLPYGYEGLYSIENLTFKNNEDFDYTALLDQLITLPNLSDLTLEVVTIFELPDKLGQLKNLTTLRIINTDEAISKNDTSLFSVEKEPITFDYYLHKGNNKFAAVKYTAMAGEIDSDEYKELSKRFNTTTNFADAGVSFTPKYVNVNPPIKGIDVERTHYTINPQIENIITYPSGTKILIPTNAFTDKEGNPITSSITISYREFRDPVDFLVSGIPMKYDTAGEITNFESAGMFELTASYKNDPIQVAKDKNINMNFASTSKDSTYNFYTFNDSSGNWEYLYKPQSVTSKTIIKLSPPTPAFQFYKNYVYYNKNYYDSTRFDKRFDDNKYVYTNFKKNKGGNNFEYRISRKNRKKSMYSLIKINNVRKTKDGTVLFKVSYINTSHPEMNAFNNVYFALNENMSAAEFRQKYARKKFYNDIRVSTSGGDVDLELKDNQSIKNISANLVSINGKGKVQDVKNLNSKMKQYSRRLKTREKVFNRSLAKGKLTHNIIEITDTNQLRMLAFKETKKLMNAAELKMSHAEWKEYCKQAEKNRIEWMKQTNSVKLAQTEKAEANASNLVQNLSLSGTGIYNCDQIQRLKQPVEVFARYKTPENEKLRPKSAYILDKTTNSVFQYDGHYGFSASKIAFSKSNNAQNTLLAVNEDGSLAIYKTEQFKKNNFKNKNSFDFVVTKINSNFTSVSDLKALIGF
ncbi:MAG: hypothetical protein A3F72_03555 [Bacteroidetes bacterium RIFCSPLOWO2_12_FULL_35_15]|nr:MAG: hypothetical protein A3F72_03555 [Bacteroidetes bacterium RIFCSPLOWO2_12_FULL_35_15]